MYDANGKPGPFVNLKNLAWGDTIILHANGSQYTYTVQDAYRTTPSDTYPLRHKNTPWLTLITCQGFDQIQNQYLWRQIVSASLTSVTGEPSTTGTQP